MNISCPHCFECVVAQIGDYRCYNCKHSFRVNSDDTITLLLHDAENWANRCSGMGYRPSNIGLIIPGPGDDDGGDRDWG